MCFFLSVFFTRSFCSSVFQLSPDFRQRASSNASSVGRLSPIPSVIDIEPSWSYANLSQDFENADNSMGCNSLTQADCLNQSATLDQLAGSLADDLNLQNEFLQGYVERCGAPHRLRKKRPMTAIELTFIIDTCV